MKFYHGKEGGDMKTECKHFDELPAMLTATELAGALGISKAGAYPRRIPLKGKWRQEN